MVAVIGGLKDPDIVMQFVKLEAEMEPEMESMDLSLVISSVVTR